MKSSKTKSISLATSTNYAGVQAIDSDPIRDLVLARQLLQAAIDKGDIGAACIYATAISKLVKPCQTWAVENNEALSERAVQRLIIKMIDAVADHVGQPLMIERVCHKLADEIKKEQYEV